MNYGWAQVQVNWQLTSQSPNQTTTDILSTPMEYLKNIDCLVCKELSCLYNSSAVFIFVSIWEWNILSSDTVHGPTNVRNAGVMWQSCAGCRDNHDICDDTWQSAQTHDIMTCHPPPDCHAISFELQ